MTTGSGGGVPSSIITRPLTKIGCGILCCGWVGCVGVVGVVGRPIVVPVVPVPVVPVPVVPVPVVPVPVVGVVDPLPWPNADAISRPEPATIVIALTQFFEVM